MSRSSVASKPSSAGSRLVWFERRFAPLMRKAGDLAFVAAVRDALPWSFIGLAAAFIAIGAWRWAAGIDRAAVLGLKVTAALLPAFGVMSAALAVILPVHLARRLQAPVAPLVAGSCAVYALLLPAAQGGDAVAYLRLVGPSGLFLAMLAAGAVGWAVWLVRRRSASAAAAWAAVAAVVAIAVVLRLVGVSVSAGIEAAMHPIAALGDTYLALIVIVAVETLLWTAGIHGPAVLAAIVTPVYLTMQMQNTHAFAVHQPLPYVVVVSLFLFIFPGGAGATLPLAVLLAFSRVPRLRKVGRVTLVPAIFNINDPLLFGAPVVFNPYLVVPFVVAPLVLATITYAATSAGIVARAAYYVPSSLPVFLSTYLATQDGRAVVLALVNVAVATAIYYPFVRAYERHLEVAPAAEAAGA